jgi:hypothetical protein
MQQCISPNNELYDITVQDFTVSEQQKFVRNISSYAEKTSVAITLWKYTGEAAGYPDWSFQRFSSVSPGKRDSFLT